MSTPPPYRGSMRCAAQHTRNICVFNNTLIFYYIWQRRTQCCIGPSVIHQTCSKASANEHFTFSRHHLLVTAKKRIKSYVFACNIVCVCVCGLCVYVRVNGCLCVCCVFDQSVPISFQPAPVGLIKRMVRL